ncbi:MAG TPA: NBR1-Ig-like domain-containing protein [Anaerolineales bacterium]|nr:NBR1-Ig-like domain-containing protein [Anaerolineales bacterium]
MKCQFKPFLTITILFTLVLTSCGANNNAIIATSVALTVQAQNTQSASVTDTPMSSATNPPLTNMPVAGTPAANTPNPPVAIPTLTPLIAQPTSSGGTTFCTASATFIGETIPDGTIESPGAIFTKTWTIQNSGTCTWDTTWKLVFVSGDNMGGGYSLSFPQTVAPGQNVDLPIVLTAPTAAGSYTGYWKLQSPWNYTFGDSDSGNPFWVTINVNSGTPGPKTPTVYGITSVTYSVTQTGTCLSANLFFYIYATIAVSGPVTVVVYWHHSDGPNMKPQTLVFNDAGSTTVQDTWSQKVGSAATNLWDQIVETSPVHQTFGKATFQNNCH